MTDDQARIATIIETTPCALCGAAPKQPCTSPRVRTPGARVWIASVHYCRRLVAKRTRKEDPLRWRRLVSQAKEIEFKEHAEYLRKQVKPE